MRRAPLSMVVLLVALAGCAAPLGSVLDPASDVGPVAFSAPVLLSTEGPGFEPSVDVAPDGTVYAAAAKSRRPHDDAQLGSWLWFSPDGGATWRELPSPAGVHKAMFGFEGETAVDAKGRFYFVDTYLPDNAVHRWSPTASGPAWDFSRPVQGTAPLVDDRPWLVAHGDGVAYLMSNNAVDAPARMWLSVSEDGGLTWLRGHGFPGARWCMPAASPADDRTVLVACHEGEGEGAPLVAWTSGDRGVTWERAWETRMEVGTGYIAPGAAFDRAGNAYVAWLDERVDWSGVQTATWAGDAPGRVMVARSVEGGAWDALDVTPFEGRFGMAHACAGSRGVLATVFYATEDLVVDDATEWRAYALVTATADRDVPTWRLAPLLDDAASVGLYPPRDLFECALGPDDAVHVVLQRDRPDLPRRPGDGIVADVLHVRQAAGPNLR